MREIKFRVYNVVSKKFIYIPNRERALHLELELMGNLFTYNLQQFTGLKDKNGKEIYEGDILRFLSLNYQVSWEGSGWSAACPYYSKHHFPRFEYFNREAGMSEVVGNIFENPELLEKSKQ